MICPTMSCKRMMSYKSMRNQFGGGGCARGIDKNLIHSYRTWDTGCQKGWRTNERRVGGWFKPSHLAGTLSQFYGHTTVFWFLRSATVLSILKVILYYTPSGNFHCGKILKTIQCQPKQDGGPGSPMSGHLPARPSPCRGGHLAQKFQGCREWVRGTDPSCFPTGYQFTGSRILRDLRGDLASLV